MANEAIGGYIKETRANGVSDAAIRTALLNMGYPLSEVDAALTGSRDELQGISASGPSAPTNQAPMVAVAAQAILPKETSGGFFRNLFTVYRSRFWVSLGLLALAFVAQLLFMGLGALVYFILFTGLIVLLFSSHSSIFIFVPVILIVIAFLFFDLWIQFIFTLAIINTNVRYQERLGVFASLRSMPRLALSYFWVAIIGGLIVAGGFFLLIVPGIFLAVAFSLAIPALVIERQRSMDALLRSRDLTKGHWWYTAGCFFATILIQGATSLLLLLLLFISPKLAVLIVPLILILNIISLPLYSAATAALFNKLRSERLEIVSSSMGRKWRYLLFVLALIAFFILLASGAMDRIFPTMPTHQQPAQNFLGQIAPATKTTTPSSPTLPVQPASVRILSPNGGEVWQDNSTNQYSITWTSQGIDPGQEAANYLQSSNGSLCEIGRGPVGSDVQYTILTSQGCFGTFNTITPGQYKAGIVVKDANGNIIASDYSDNWFTIAP